MRLFILLCFSLLAVPSIVLAQETSDPQPPKSLQDMVTKGAQIFYLGNYEGMNGWALVNKGKPEYFYENEKRTAIVMGMLFNAEGEMITSGQLGELYERVGDDMYATTGGAVSETSVAAEEDPLALEDTSPENNRPLTKGELMFLELLDANWVTINPDGQYDVFAFWDPGCPHCRNFIKQAQPFLNDEGLRLRVMPMGNSAEDKKRAAVLLASADPGERMLKFAQGNKEVLAAPATINIDGVEKNFNFMLKHGFNSTPMLVYRTGKGEIRLVRGRPNDINVIINDIRQN